MRNTYTILISLTLLLLAACGQQCDDARAMGDPVHTREEMEKAIVDSGSLDAYGEYLTAFMDYDGNKYWNMVAMAKIMANRYHYANAHYIVYYALYYQQEPYPKDDYSLDKLSEADRDTAIHYLKLGAANKDDQCMKKLGEYYLRGQYVPQDSAKGKALIAGSEKQ